MTNAITTSHASAVPFRIAAVVALVAIGWFCAPLVSQLDQRRPATIEASSQAGTFRTAYLTEMRAGCIKSAREHGASEDKATQFCGCLTDHAATLPSVELVKISIDPSRLDPQIQICLRQREA